MLIHETRTRVHAPLDRVLAFLEDPRRLPAYSEKARQIEVLGRSPERVRVSGHVGPQAFTTELEISRDPASGFSFERVRGDGPFVRGQILAGLEDGFTMLTHREEWLFERGWTERLWAPSLKAIAAREADRIKQHVEWALIHELLDWRPQEPVFTVTWIKTHDPAVPEQEDATVLRP